MQSGVENTNDLLTPFNAEIFRKQGHQIIDMFADYIAQATSGSINKVLPAVTPEQMIEAWSDNFSKAPSNDLIRMIKQVLDDSNHLHHPHFVGHQVSPPLPAAALCDFVSSFLNNGMAVFEMGPAATAMEKSIIQWMSGLIGYDFNADGILTSGGSLGNLTALLAARQSKAGYDIWTQGNNDNSALSVMVSEQAHYSVKRAVQIMGLGEKGIIPVPANETYSLNPDALESAYQKALKEGRKIFAVVGNACSTATGSYDSINQLADFCEKHDLWLHIDGAHGASALVSEKYRYLLNGIERADSVIWDAHKMLLMPALITAVIFKDKRDSYEAFSQKASYLYEKKAEEEWYNLGHRTLECTKRMMCLKLYVALSIYGTDFFSDYITYTYDLAQKFYEMIESSSDFEAAIKPQSNIICFRYIPPQNTNLDTIQQNIRQQILADESFYLVQTGLKEGVYLRCTLVNPFTTEKHLTALLDKIRSVAKNLNH